MRVPGPDDPVGASEIARLLGVKPSTVAMWQGKSRNLLPAPDWPEVGGRPAWRWARILAWAEETNRVRPVLRIGELVELAAGRWRPELEVEHTTVGTWRLAVGPRIPIRCVPVGDEVDDERLPVHVATVHGLPSEETQGTYGDWAAVAPETAGLAGGTVLASAQPTEVGAAREAVKAVAQLVEDATGTAPQFDPLSAPRRPGLWRRHLAGQREARTDPRFSALLQTEEKP